MIDDQAALRTFLLADAGVSALVGTRIHGALSVPPEGWKPGDGALVAFRRRGGLGPLDEVGMAISVSYQLKIYGGGSSFFAQKLNAEEVYRAVYEALTFASSGAILGAQPEGMPASLEEPEAEANWPFVLAFWRVQFRKTG